MSKVLVDRELLERVTNMLDAHNYAKDAEALMAAIAQPAEAEGAVEMGSDAWMALHLLDRLDVSADEEPRAQQVEEIVRRMGAALSAVTAENDDLRAQCGGMQMDIDELRAEVEALRKAKTATALHAAVGAIYFDDGSDFGSALWEVVRNLAPELIDELESNQSAVWHKTEAMAAKEA